MNYVSGFEFAMQALSTGLLVIAGALTSVHLEYDQAQMAILAISVRQSIFSI